MPTQTIRTPRSLRPYQQEAVNAVLSQWGSETRRTAVALPTGTGKSTVIAAVASEAAKIGLRVVMLAHRAELLDQMAGTVATVNPELPPVGIVRAQSDESDAQIVAASLQTLTNAKRHAALGKRDVVLWDEVHHGGAASWREVLDNFGTDIFFCGFSATLRREDGKALREIIDSVAYERDLRWAIKEGYLVKPQGLTVAIPGLDLDKVKTTAGDFQQNELAEVMEGETHEVVKAILKHCAPEGYRPIIFAASVDAAHGIAESLVDSGMEAEAVTGAMSYEERQPIYKRYRQGETRALCTVQVLTEGADFPMCDCVVIARPTKSQNLYSQMVGRALRTASGKDHALVLDLVGTSRVLKLVTLSDLDAGTVSRKVDTEGVEIPPDDEELNEPAVKSFKRRLGPIDVTGIDLLGPDNTGVLWLATRKGVPFLSPMSMDKAVFLWETEPGLYRIGVIATRGHDDYGWLDAGKAWPLSTARDIAEDWVIDQDFSLPLRSTVNNRRGPATEGQVRFARRLGIADVDMMTNGRATNEISIALASERLDGSR